MQNVRRYELGKVVQVTEEKEVHESMSNLGKSEFHVKAMLLTRFLQHLIAESLSKN